VPDWKEEISKHVASLNLTPQRETEIVDELSQHLDDRYHELLADGAASEEAFHRSLAELGEGNSLAHKLRRLERAVPADSVILRESGSRNLVAGVWRDLRYGVRAIRLRLFLFQCC